MKMTLRDHPFLTYQGVRSWPPRWVRTAGEQSAIAEGEVGILQDVKTHDAMSSNCFLFIAHNGATFIGRLLCDSSAACQQIVKALKRHRGEPLRSIGELGIDLEDMPLPVCDSSVS
jgi:hypothetical protein